MADADDDATPYANVREFLGRFIGRRVVDITQHDEDEWTEDGSCYIELMFEDGATLRFHITNEGGFDVHEPD